MPVAVVAEPGDSPEPRAAGLRKGFRHVTRRLYVLGILAPFIAVTAPIAIGI